MTESFITRPRSTRRTGSVSVKWRDPQTRYQIKVSKWQGSNLYFTTIQVIKPVNLDALSKWVGHIPDDVIEDMASIAPMLAHFG